MNTHIDQEKSNTSQAISNSLPKLQSSDGFALQSAGHIPQANTKQNFQEVINNSPRVQQLKAYQEMADSSLRMKQSTQLKLMPVGPMQQTIQPMLRRLGGGGQGNDEERSASSRRRSAPNFSLDNLEAGTTCYRFVTMLGGREPDISYSDFRDDEDGGVSLTLNPEATPKGRPAKGRWKLTYVLLSTTNMYRCQDKSQFKSILDANPRSLCYTDREAELKCKAASFQSLFRATAAEKHFPVEASAAAAVGTPEASEERFSRFNPETGFYDTDWNALFEDRWKRREVEMIPADGVAKQFDQAEAEKFTSIGGGAAIDKNGYLWTVKHFDATLNRYYIKEER